MKYAFPIFLAAILVFPPRLTFAQERSADFARGEELFMQNKPEEALPFLERAFAADGFDREGALYLAVCYEQLDRFDEAITVYRHILPQAGDKTALVACNIGNNYFRTGNASLAEQFYTQAIRADPSYAPAHLNRANTRVRNGALQEALQDYQRYLGLEPDSAQQPQIERLIVLIQELFAEAEIRRIMAQESSRADAEKWQRLMNEELAASIPEMLDAEFSPEENADGEKVPERNLEWRGDLFQRK